MRTPEIRNCVWQNATRPQDKPHEISGLPCGTHLVQLAIEWSLARDDGFSLIELLIVVALVAVLAGIAVPAIAGSDDAVRAHHREPAGGQHDSQCAGPGGRQEPRCQGAIQFPRGRAIPGARLGRRRAWVGAVTAQRRNASALSAAPSNSTRRGARLMWAARAAPVTIVVSNGDDCTEQNDHDFGEWACPAPLNRPESAALGAEAPRRRLYARRGPGLYLHPDDRHGRRSPVCWRSPLQAQIGARESARSTRLAQDKMDELMKLNFTAADVPSAAT